MLKKLYKYEFLSLYRILLPLYGALLGLSAITRLVYEIDVKNDTLTTVLEFWKKFLMGISIATVIGIFVVGTVLVIIRFYQNLLSKQGYLTNTLPFKAHNHITCKLICGVVVIISNVIVAFSSLLIMLGTAKLFEKVGEIIKLSYKSMLLISTKGEIISIGVEMLAVMLFSMATGILMYYAAMAIGQQFRNKILASVIAYFCLYAAVETVSTIFVVIFTVFGASWFDALAEFNPMLMVHGTLIFSFVAVIIQGIAYYIIANHFLSKKLNLE